MAVFPSRPFRPSSAGSGPRATLGEKIGVKYRANLSRHPFLLFGLPFMTVIVGASFLLTPATALRYERHDRKVQQVSQQEAMSLGIRGRDGDGNSNGDDGARAAARNPRRRQLGTEKEEYYRLMAKDLDNWEQKRVQRFKGEPDGRL